MLQLLLFVSPESFPSLRPTFYRHFQSSVLALHPAPDGRLHAHPAFIDARNLELLRTLRLSDGFPVDIIGAGGEITGSVADSSLCTDG